MRVTAAYGCTRFKNRNVMNEDSRERVMVFLLALVLTLGLLTAVLATFLYTRVKGDMKGVDKGVERMVTRDTVWDTVRCEVPVARDSVVLRWVRVSGGGGAAVGTNESGLRPYSGTNDEGGEAPGDGGEAPGDRQKEGEVWVPIVQKEYGDSTYRAWVSGYMASLDSIEIYRMRETVTVRERVRKRWGWCVGPAVGVGWNGRNWGPYVGIGIQWGYEF